VFQFSPKPIGSPCEIELPKLLELNVTNTLDKVLVLALVPPIQPPLVITSRPTPNEAIGAVLNGNVSSQLPPSCVNPHKNTSVRPSAGRRNWRTLSPAIPLRQRSRRRQWLSSEPHKFSTLSPQWSNMRITPLLYQKHRLGHQTSAGWHYCHRLAVSFRLPFSVA
jgi:hypothetical protein